MRTKTLWHRGLRRLRGSRTEAEHIQTWLLLPLLPRISLLLQLVADDAGRRRPLRAPDRRLHPREADGVAVRHCRRRLPARRGAPLSDPPPPKLDPKIGSPSLREAVPPVLPRRRGPSPPDFGRPCPPLP